MDSFIGGGPKDSVVVGSMVSVNPKELKVFIKNDGPGKIILPDGALCSIWASKKSAEIEESDESGVYGYKHPVRSQVAGRYIYLYDSNKPDKILNGSETEIIAFKFRETSKQVNPVGDFKKDEPIVSYCHLIYKKETGEDIPMIFNLEAYQAVLFSLDMPSIKKLLRK